MSDDELPKGWVETTIDSLVAARVDIVDGPFGSNLKTAHYTPEGPRVVRLQNIADGRFIDEHAHISQEHYESLLKHNVKHGDVLVASLGEQLPRACLVPPGLGDAIVKADCLRIRPADGVSPAFLMYALNAPALREEVGLRIRGVGRPRINLGDVRAMTVLVPPSSEQERIVKEIERRLSHVEAAQRSIAMAEKKLRLLRAAVLEACVTGQAASQDPADEPAVEILRRLGYGPGKAKDPLPIGWAWAPLGSLVASRGDIIDGPFGSNLKSEHYTEAGPRVVRLQNISDGRFVDARAHIDEERFKTLARHDVKSGDVLVASLGEVLPRACVAPDWLGPAIVKADCLRIRLSPDVSPQYICYVLNSPRIRSFVSELVRGVGRPRVNLGDLRRVEVPLPPTQEQLRIVVEADRLLSSVDAAEATLNRQRSRLAATRRSILAAAFRGELVTQDPDDEPAEALLQRIRDQRAGTAQSRPVDKTSTSAGRKPRAKKESIV